MKIQWLGHSCFLLTAEDGTRLLTDPFNDKVGYPLPNVRADVVTVSHQHGDHNYTQAVTGPFEVIDKPGAYDTRGLAITGVPTFHDNAQGAQRGSNIVFRVVMDGLAVVHCGDLGHPLSPEQVAALEPVDVLLVPVGGYYTIDAPTALALIQTLNPAVAIPMHFKTGQVAYPIAPVDVFLQAAGGGQKAHAQSVDLRHDTIRDYAGILVLDPPG